MMQKYIPYALMAGVAASTVACLAKSGFEAYNEQAYMFTLVAVALYIAANGAMWWAHSRALVHCDNTLQPVVLNSSANFVLTGVLGSLLFAETKSLYWWSGLGLIVLGTYLVGSTSRQEQEKKKR